MKFAFAALVAAWAVAGAAAAQPSPWFPSAQGQGVPRGAQPAGDNGDGTPLFVCRARHQGGIHPGKVYAGNCNIGWGGKEIVIGAYEVLVGRLTWGRPTPGAGVVGGDNWGNGREPLLICRAAYRGGVHPGKVWKGNCNIGWGGQEIVLPRYEVLMGVRR